VVYVATIVLKALYAHITRQVAEGSLLPLPNAAVIWARSR